MKKTYYPVLDKLYDHCIFPKFFLLYLYIVGNFTKINKNLSETGCNGFKNKRKIH
jgi:hypothetical protein